MTDDSKPKCRKKYTYRSEESRKARAERMRTMHADPAFKEKHAERMRTMNADPAFKEKLRKLSAERMRTMHADPAFKEKHAERMRTMHADPAFNPLAALTKEQRADYDILRKKGGYTRDEALSILAESTTT